MAAIFTPGLKVKERTIVQRERRLPLQGDVRVELGQSLRADDVVARTELPGKVFPINLANKLGINASQLPETMLVETGQPITQGQVVARTAGFFGWFKSEAEAIVTGTIESVSSVTGQVIFQAAPIPVEIDAYINGRVVELIEGEGCVVQASAALVQGIFGLGGEVKAPLRMVVKSPDERLLPDHIDPSMKGAILIGGGRTSLEALQRAIEVGAAGVVTGGFDYDDIREVLGYEVGVAITGGEKLGPTLLVTEGFGEIPMAAATWELLGSLEGRQASMNGATQIRAGVIRPEVVVPLDDDVPTEKVAPAPPTGIGVGQAIRGIRTPHFGRLGTVVDLPVEPVVLDTESKARVMRVRFEDGSEVVVPRANVEVIER